MKIEFAIPLDHRAYTPGEEISGLVRWSGAAADSAELRLFWFTEGQGSRDVGLLAKEEWPQLPPSGERAFQFLLPNGPFSFSGTLISLRWALEVLVEPGGASARYDFVLGPEGRELVLGRVEDPESEGKPGRWGRFFQKKLRGGEGLD